MLQKYTGSIKEKRRQRRHVRVRGKISGTADRPRVCVTRSLKNVYVQAIDDTAHATIAGLHSKGIKNDKKSTKNQVSKQLGQNLGNILKEQGITTVVFDRGGFSYHGRVQALAEGLREAGITV